MTIRECLKRWLRHSLILILWGTDIVGTDYLTTFEADVLPLS